MSDLIDRQEAIDAIEPWLNVKGYSEGEMNMLKAVLYELRMIPSAQPEIIACGQGELVQDGSRLVQDVISRQAAIDALMEKDKKLRNINWYDKPYAEGECRGIDEALSIISNLPSAQPERKKGKWFFSDTDFLTHCSNCGQSEWKGYCPTPEEATEWMPICPKCGADMREETEDAKIH